MLIISRGVEEELIIGESIRLKVLEIKKDKSVKIGISAPRSVQVDRKELRDKKNRRISDES